jgi:glycosyltransferase involved in cell wall biosynthesis
MVDGVNAHLYPSPLTNESRLLRIARTLVESRTFAEVILVGQRYGTCAPRETVNTGVTIERIGPLNRVGQSRLRRMLFLLWWGIAVIRMLRLKSLRCINCHSLFTLPIGVVLKCLTGALLVYDTHELETEVAALSGAQRSLARWTERLCMLWVDQVFCVSEAISKWYKAAYPSVRIETVLNTPRDMVSAKPVALRESLGFLPETRLFLYQGLLAKGRGLEAVIDAFCNWERSDVGLVILGYGPLAQSLRERAGGSARVRFLDAVPPDELAGYTLAADVGISLIEPISLSYEYCMPNKLFEYLAAGKPVVASATLEQARFIRMHNIGVVAEGFSVASIRAAAATVLRTTAAEWATRCAVVRKTVNWGEESARMLNVYRMLLKRCT